MLVSSKNKRITSNAKLERMYLFLIYGIAFLRFIIFDVIYKTKLERLVEQINQGVQYFKQQLVSSNLNIQKYVMSIFLEVLIISMGLLVFYIFPFTSFYFRGFEDFGLSDMFPKQQLQLSIFGLCYIILVPYLFIFKIKKGSTSKAYQLFETIYYKKHNPLTKQIVLTFLLKLLFIPIMFHGVTFYSELIYEIFVLFAQNGVPESTLVEWINNVIFPLYVYITLWYALSVYLFGYCVESERIGSKIKSIDTTFFGWIVTIICYTPLYELVFYVIPKGDQDFAFFKNEEITALVRVFIMIVILFKTWTIYTLGTKSSNLTNRGIVTHGAYRWVRHPHYLAKIIVWWICLLPSGWLHPWLFGGMVFWTMIYVLRALTEEDHLKKDIDYQDYMKKVKWRFIPGVY